MSELSKEEEAYYLLELKEIDPHFKDTCRGVVPDYGLDTIERLLRLQVVHQLERMVELLERMENRDNELQRGSKSDDTG